MLGGLLCLWWGAAALRSHCATSLMLSSARIGLMVRAHRTRIPNMRRRDALTAILSLGAAVSLGACEKKTERTERTWRVGLLLAGLSEAAVATHRRVIVEHLERHGFVEGRNLRLEVRRGGYSPTEDA